MAETDGEEERLRLTSEFFDAFKAMAEAQRGASLAKLEMQCAICNVEWPSYWRFKKVDAPPYWPEKLPCPGCGHPNATPALEELDEV